MRKVLIPWHLLLDLQGFVCRGSCTERCFGDAFCFDLRTCSLHLRFSWCHFVLVDLCIISVERKAFKFLLQGRKRGQH